MTTAEPSHLPYWARKLAGFQHRPRPFPAFLEAPGETVAGVPVAWPAELRAGSEADGLDLLCLGALAALVARYAGESEVLIAAQGACAPVFHRVAAEPGTSPREFLRALDAERRESQARADYAYADLLALLEPEAPGAAAACFQVAYRGVGDHGAWPEGITPALSLTLEAPGRLCLSAHGYEAAFVTQLAGQLGRALAFLARGDAPELDALDLLDADQERRVALEFNAHAAEYPETGRTLHALGALQAARRPEAEAVVFEGRRLTRAQVQDLAARLALHLRTRRGVRPGDAVGLVLKRSELMPPVMLGVLMAGAAYVPIDPRHPRPVVDGMLADAGVRVLLVDSDSAAHAATFQGEVLVTDVELDELPPAAAPLPATSDEELAYVIFTSGSTGRPKGVAIEHRAIVNTVAWRNRFYGFGDDDAILQMPSYAFDSSVLDFFCAHTSGARLVIPDADRRLDPDYLLRLVAAERVTHFIVTPSYYGVLVAGLAAAGTLLLAVGLGTSQTLSAALFYVVPSTLVVAAMFLLVDRVQVGRPGGGACATSTGRPRTPCAPRPPGSRPAGRARPSARPSPTCARWCSTRAAVSRPWACRARSTWAARGWPAATSASPSRPRPPSSPARGPSGARAGSTAPATAAPGAATGSSSSSGAPTTRSRCAATASSSTTSRACCARIPPWPRRRWWSRAASSPSGGWRPTTWRAGNWLPRRCGASWPSACRISWCPT